MATRATMLAVLLIQGLFGCAANVDEASSEPALDADERADAWNAKNSPHRFGTDLEYNLAALPTSGRAEREAWPSTYWPAMDDSFNARWAGVEQMSPAEKYDLAFNGWRPRQGFMSLRPFEAGVTCGADARGFDPYYYDALGPFARYVHVKLGNARAHNGIDNDGDGRIDECDDHDGIGAWWGSCHAWSAAAIVEDRPLGAVTHNGVTFEVGDLEALLIAAYTKPALRTLGSRCNRVNEPDGGRVVVRRDDDGRVLDTECRDVNAGAYHVIMANFLGLRREAIGEDRTADYEVWNQPVVGFETIVNEIPVEIANEMLGDSGQTYRFNPFAKRFAHALSKTTWIQEAFGGAVPASSRDSEQVDAYEYVLELDEAGNILGGEWIGASRAAHPDFLWRPERLAQSTVPQLDLERVRMLVAQSRR